MKMDKSNRNSPHIEDFRDLLPIIQSLLPIKEAARTCVLSKAWLHAWYTMPSLNFSLPGCYFRKQDKRFMTYIDRTLFRYHRYNIPLYSIYLAINIGGPKTASVAEKWIRSVASKSTLEELNLKIYCSVRSFSLTDEIFSGKNLKSVRVELEFGPLWMPINSVINCVSLRVLELISVHISEEVLDKLLYTCSLLEKIRLEFLEGFKTIKVKNLLHLRELTISGQQNEILQINNVPSLRLFSYSSTERVKPLPFFDRTSLGGVTELYLYGLIIQDDFFNKIQSNFPFLENLTIQMIYSCQERLDITCVSLKRLTLELINKSLKHIQVYAPNLTFFSYNGKANPSLLFSAAVPEQIKLKTSFMGKKSDHSFSLKMKEAMNVPSKFQIVFQEKGFISPPLYTDDAYGLRRNDSFPDMNKQRLSHKASSSKADSWDQSPILDVVFTICHPSYYIGRNRCPSFGSEDCLCKITIREVIKKESRECYWPNYLQHVTIAEIRKGYRPDYKVYQII